MEIIILQIVVVLFVLLLNARTQARMAEFQRMRLQETAAIRDATATIQEAMHAISERFQLREQLAREKAMLQTSDNTSEDVPVEDPPAGDLEESLPLREQHEIRIIEIEAAMARVTDEIQTMATRWGPQPKAPRHSNAKNSLASHIWLPQADFRPENLVVQPKPAQQHAV